MARVIVAAKGRSVTLDRASGFRPGLHLAVEDERPGEPARLHLRLVEAVSGDCLTLDDYLPFASAGMRAHLAQQV